MPLQKLQFKPGINRETTSYTNEGGWFDCDKVRFRQGFPEKIGGWTRLGSRSFLGSCRAMHTWSTTNLDIFLGLGTSDKYYIEEGEAYYDITPIRQFTDTFKDITVGVVGVSAAGSVGEADVETNLEEVSGTIATASVGKVAVLTAGDVIASVTGVYAAARVSPVTVATENARVELEGLSATASVGYAAASAVVSESALDMAAVDGSSSITVSQTNHGAVVGDYVTFAGCDSLGGNITAAILNQEYKIDSVVDDNTYTFTAREVNSVANITIDGQYTPVPVTANASDTGDGGRTITASYQINVGIDTSILGNGWGAGAWSSDAWGVAADVNVLTDTLRLWEHDNFGEDLVMNVYNGGIYYWDASLTDPLTRRAVPLTALYGARDVPVVATKTLVSNVDRHVIAFGANPLGGTSQDPLLIRFSDQENIADWRPTTTNTAGDLQIGSGSKIVTAIETRQQILVFTDISLHAMQYLGPPFTFGINMISENITINGPKSAIAIDDNVFWMGLDEFYMYTGSVQKLPCAVKDYVFSDFNLEQKEKVFASSNTSFSEIWWFYPSANSSINDKYVVYNYEQNLWYYGTMSRTAWIDRGVSDRPLAASTDNYLYTHEVGSDDGSTNPVSPVEAYIESSQIDLGEGDNFSFVRRLIPDLTFRSSTSLEPIANFTLKARNFPGGNYLQSNTKNVEKTASVPVEQFTADAHVRLRGRSIAIRVGSDETGVQWRLGSPRIEIRQDGRR